MALADMMASLRARLGGLRGGAGSHEYSALEDPGDSVRWNRIRRTSVWQNRRLLKLAIAVLGVLIVTFVAVVYRCVD